MSTKNLVSSLLAVALAAVAGAACAAVPETVPVGNKGNAADTTGFGAVPYEYKIGKYEVTIEQYCEFLNAVAKSDPDDLYEVRMEAGEEDGWGGIKREGDSGSYTYSVITGRGKQPIGYVTWLSCIRYCNWLSNGQGKGDTEKGSYIIEGDWPDKVKIPDHAELAKGKVKWVIPSENEWYKAAYYDPTKAGGGGYWQYPVKSDTAPAANFNSNWPSVVGKYKESVSPYGTYDQGGNQWEYNDTVSGDYAKVGLRGGSWYINDNDSHMLSSSRYDVLSAKWPHRGFRVVALGSSDAK